MSKLRWPDKHPDDSAPLPAPPQATGSDGSGVKDGEAPGSPGQAGPPDTPASGPSTRSRWFGGSKLPWILAFVCSVVVTAVIAAAIVEVPYFALQPGSVHDTSEAVAVDGASTFATDGTINFTTVSIKPIKAIDLMVAWLDDDVDIRTRREILGDRGDEENREINQFLMDDSQEVATKVALETLGYDVEVNVAGELVHRIEEGTPADGVLEPGDVILEIDGDRLDAPDALQQILEDKSPGDEITLLVTSLLNEEAPPTERTLALAEAPDTGNAYMGIVISPLNDYEFPLDVTFDTGDIGGPSAGLAFTLTIIDKLSEGDLTGGLDVAVTGSVDSHGNVHTVGGTGQKAAAARKAGMDLFLVPAEGKDYDHAVPHAGDVEIVRVTTVEDALDVLAERNGDPLDSDLTPAA